MTNRDGQNSCKKAALQINPNLVCKRDDKKWWLFIITDKVTGARITEAPTAAGAWMGALHKQGVTS